MNSYTTQIYELISFHYRVRSTIFSLDHNGDISYVRWSPAPQGPVIETKDASILDAFFTAYKQFYRFVENCPPKVNTLILNLLPYISPADIIGDNYFHSIIISLLHNPIFKIQNLLFPHIGNSYSKISAISSAAVL